MGRSLYKLQPAKGFFADFSQIVRVSARWGEFVQICQGESAMGH